MNRSNSITQAALVLNRLPKRQAAKIISRLKPEDIKTVLDAMSQQNDATASEVSTAVLRFTRESCSNPGGLESDEMRNILGQVDGALDDVHAIAEGGKESSCPFDFLHNVIPLVRNHLLADEHPRNIAIVVSLLPPEIASLTLRGLEDQLQLSVMKRLCEIEKVTDAEVADLRFQLNQHLHRLMNSGHVDEDGVNAAIRLLGCSEPDLRDQLLAQVNQTDPDLALKLQRSTFKLDRLLTLDDVEIQVILRNVDTASWAPALKNASYELTDKVLSNMATAPASCLRLELEEIGFVCQSIEELARQSVVEVVLRMGRERKIELRKNGPRDKTSVPESAFGVDAAPGSQRHQLLSFDFVAEIN